MQLHRKFIRVSWMFNTARMFVSIFRPTLEDMMLAYSHVLYIIYVQYTCCIKQTMLHPAGVVLTFCFLRFGRLQNA